jgi:Astacin (Peptidase family M12A)
LMGQPSTASQAAADQTVAELMEGSGRAGGEGPLREALSKIAELAGAAVERTYHSDHDHEPEYDRTSAGRLSCAPKSLPPRLLLKAAETAIRVNPVNAPAFWRRSAIEAGITVQPQFIAVLTSKYWGPKPRQLTVSFMESAAPELRERIIGHLNAWTKTGCISFVETQGTGQIRISREPGGYWSYVGTDVLQIPKSLQTMNLDGFTMTTPDSEYRRVVRHEAGHTLGFPHEHMRKEIVARIDPEKAYRYCLEEWGWDKRMVDEQILTPLHERSILGTPADQTSIMCYRFPGLITRDGQPIPGGDDINKSDYEFVARIYPRAGRGLMDEQVDRPKRYDDWPESEDVELVDV